jgi:RimJ/RimL family protein N-acetyltransferase
MVSDPDALTFIGKSFPSVATDPPRLLGCFARLRRAGISHFAWAVVDQVDELVGHVELKKTPKAGERELELIYIIRREFRRRGFATDAVRQALTTVDESTDASAVVAFVNSRNVASRRALERVGFTAAHRGDSEYRYRLKANNDDRSITPTF